MMFYKVVLTFLVISALSVNVSAAPTSLTARTGPLTWLKGLRRQRAERKKIEQEREREQQKIEEANKKMGELFWLREQLKRKMARNEN